jgi:DNA-binding CsgD family transcriptional regulator
MSPINVLDIVEAAYQCSDRDEQWLSAVIGLSQGALDRGYGLVGHLYNFSSSDARQTLETSALIGSHGVDLLSIWHRILRELPDHLVARATRYFCTSSPLFTARRAMQIEYPDAEELFDCYLGRLGVADSLTLNAHATAREGLMIQIPSRDIVSLDPATRRRWSMIAAHLASGLRLRRALHAAAAADSVADPIEAVLSPDGRVQDASGPAKTRQARENLRCFVIRLDRARAQAARSGGDEADKTLSLWTGLVDGRWSVVDRFESDGRRYLVAYRNDCSLPDPRALNPREAQVCRLLSYGHANKYIAYELGLSTSTVATHISSSRQKLRASSRVELIQILQAALTAAS